MPRGSLCGFDKVLWCTEWHRKVPCGPVLIGPYWHYSKITWANIVNAVLDVGTKSENFFDILGVHLVSWKQMWLYI